MVVEGEGLRKEEEMDAEMILVFVLFAYLGGLAFSFVVFCILLLMRCRW